MTNAFELRGKVLKLLAGQPLAVLATHGSARSYASLVAFAFTDDLAFLVFATPRSTRKFANLQSSQNVAFLIDNRSNRESDFQETTAATVTGIAEEVPPEERSRFLNSTWKGILRCWISSTLPRAPCSGSGLTPTTS